MRNKHRAANFGFMTYQRTHVYASVIPNLHLCLQYYRLLKIQTNTNFHHIQINTRMY